jgi:CHAD domain-containing protein
VKRGKKLAELDPHSRHKLRIATKKLRYAGEFFSSLFPTAPKRKQKFLTALKEMQNTLGELNDIITHEQLSADLADHPARRAHANSRGGVPFIAGISFGYEESKLDEVLRASAQSHRRFAETPKFW